jgi:hypothetical protein
VRRLWVPIVEAGPGTIWECGVVERGRPAFGGQGSLCHGFSTAPVDLLQGEVLGVRPLAPGFERCRVAPRAAGLTAARGVVPTPHGELVVGWVLGVRGVALHVAVPRGVTVELADGRLLAAGTHRVVVTTVDS